MLKIQYAAYEDHAFNFFKQRLGAVVKNCWASENVRLQSWVKPHALICC